MNILRCLEDSNFVVSASALGWDRTCDSSEFLQAGVPDLRVLPAPEQRTGRISLSGAALPEAQAEELAFRLLFLAGAAGIVGGFIWALLA